MKYFLLLALMPLLFTSCSLQAQSFSAQDIIRKTEDKMHGDQLFAEMKMTIVRPKWQREMTMKTWSKGQDYSMVVITSPARDKGTAFLKRKKEIWNWQPSIDRSIKLPPSMMTQSWMGSDFTNDDLVRESSIVNDFTPRLLGRENIDGRECHRLELIPKPEAAVVWGRLLMWVDVKEYMQLKVEFYDEEGALVNTMFGKDIKTLGGRTLPARLELIPADKPGQMTIIEQLSLDFNLKVEESWFSLQNLKKVK